MLKGAAFLCACLVIGTGPATYAARQETSRDVPDKKRSGGMDAKGILSGAGFVMTIIHPMRGDFSDYDKLEVVEMVSEVGDRIPKEKMRDYTSDLATSFTRAGIFRSVTRTDRVSLATPRLIAAAPPDAPVENDAPASVPEPAKRTIVMTSRVIYYKPGNRGLRAIGLGLGTHRFVVRFYLYDKERGVEVAMGNISGEVDGSFGSVPFIAGDSDARNAIVAAIVNRTEIRQATSAR